MIGLPEQWAVHIQERDEHPIEWRKVIDYLNSLKQTASLSGSNSCDYYGVWSDYDGLKVRIKAKVPADVAVLTALEAVGYI